MDLDSLKYAELQRLAKEVGLKANMKVNRVYYGNVNVNLKRCSAVKPFHV